MTEYRSYHAFAEPGRHRAVTRGGRIISFVRRLLAVGLNIDNDR